MGIKNLHKVLQKHCPDVYKKVPLHTFAFQKIAIDISLYMFKYKTILGESKWLTAFINLVSKLRKNNIHTVFIFDSKAPIEKQQEQQERRIQRQKIKDKLSLIETDYKNYQKTGIPSQILIELCHDETQKHKKLLSNNSTKIFREDIIIEKIEKLKLQTISISKEDFDLVKQLFDILGVKYYQAVSEAEATCSYLCRRKKVVGVLSEDTDVLCYKTPIFITKIDVFNETCVVIYIKDVLESLDFTYKQFRDLCIMLGTDYNKNIPKIGMVKSFNLISTYKGIEGIESNTILDTSILKYKRSRELFSFPKKYFNKKIKFCQPPKLNLLDEFLFVNNCHFNINTIKSYFEPSEIIFED